MAQKKTSMRNIGKKIGLLGVARRARKTAAKRRRKAALRGAIVGAAASRRRSPRKGAVVSRTVSRRRTSVRGRKAA